MMSMNRPAAPAARAAPQQHQTATVAPQQRQPQQEMQQHQMQVSNQSHHQQQIQVSNHQSHQFACLFTHQKTQKRKKWRDGRFVLQTFGRGKLYDANPAPGSGNPVLAEVEINRNEVNALIQKHQTTLEAEKYLIQLEGLWVEPTTMSHSSRGPTMSNSMQKLMSRKFKRPGAFKPPNPQFQNSNGGALGKRRRRPLQPGELVRQHYGNAAGPSTNNPNQCQTQAGPPNQNLSAWNTPANQGVATRPPQPFSSHRPQQNAYNRNPPPQQNGSNWNRSQQHQQQQNGFNKNYPPHQFGHGHNNEQDPIQHRGQHFAGNNQQPTNDSNGHHLTGLTNNSSAANPVNNPYRGAAQPPQSNGLQGTNHQHPVHQGQMDQSGPGHNNDHGGNNAAQPANRRQEEFARNGFDPHSFYGLDDEEEESDEDGADPFAPGYSRTASAAKSASNAVNDRSSEQGLGSNSNSRTGASTTPTAPSTTNTNDGSNNTNNNNDTLTNEDLLDIFGGGVDDQSQTQDEDEDEEEVQADKENAQKASSGGNGGTTTKQNTAGSTNPPSNNAAPEFTLPPVYSSSSDSSDDDEN